jgi:hypothetical protein
MIDEWVQSNGTSSTLESQPANGIDIAVDGSGDVYLLDPYVDGGVFEWTPGSTNINQIISSGLNQPAAIAADTSGNLYIADTFNDAIEKWTAASQTVTPLVSVGLNEPIGVSVDVAGNVYISDLLNDAEKEWIEANNTVTTLTPPGFTDAPYWVAVDGMGNVYMDVDGRIMEWVAASNSLVTLPYLESKMAVDAADNLYFSYSKNIIQELPHAFLDLTPKSESMDAGTDVLPPVLSLTSNLLSEFFPTSDEPWLTITGVTNGVVSFGFTANTGPNRAATITVLGQPVQVVQSSPVNFLNAVSSPGGVFQISFSNFQNSSFTVLSSTNVSLPLTDWTVVGAASNIGPNFFQFTDSQATNCQRYYMVRSP